MSYGASTQSKWVLTLSAAISGDGPEANRPPHSGVAAVAGVRRCWSGSGFRQS